MGFHTEFMTATSGEGLFYRVFDHFGPLIKKSIAKRPNGVMISIGPGKSSGFSLWNLQERGKMLITPQTEVYEGMIVGLHSRDNDLVVNVIKGKQLTNVRASGTDENINLVKVNPMTLEEALEFIDDDELVEVTPNFLRLRKKFLKEHERKKATRTQKA